MISDILKALVDFDALHKMQRG